ncbi:CPBP family intramembrane glutamic endopeptidase [Niallia nealsonii]|uniref:CPBP family intramembrane glutamic endopeptidase n=1 Tax=Niallia nealsonii TaxID=115979 RepID=UPI0012FEB7FE|nr:CPBP family intramembrane glutamic endopeptidase [Niallia nealsonii]
MLFVPLQTTVEELIFRGFLLQWFAKKNSHPFLLPLLVALIFGSLHFTNPEMEKSTLWVGLNYIWGGFMLTFFAVKAGRSELSIGAHAANNMFILWFLAEEKSTDDGSVPSLFKVVDVHPATNLMWNICIFLLFYFFIQKKYSSFKRRSDHNVTGRYSHS